MSVEPTVASVSLNPAVDVGLVVDELLVDHKMIATSVRRDPGGGGVNVARSLHRLGTACVAVVATAGATGRELDGMLTGEGITTRSLTLDGHTRESVSLTDASTRRQYRVVTPGPEVDPTAVVPAVIGACRDREVVVLSGRLNPGLPDDTYRRIADALPDALVVVDCAPPALEQAFLGDVALIKPSRRELETVVGRTLGSVREVAGAARDLIAGGGVGAVVVSLGGDGAVLVERDHPACRFEPPAIDEVISTVGCGDAMVAGMVRALSMGRPLEVAVGFGVACGSAAATTPGTALFQPAMARDLETRMVPPVEV